MVASRLPKKNNQLWRRIFRMRALYGILIIPSVLLFIFHYLPIYGMLIAFKDFKYAEGIVGSRWVGILNFEKAFLDVLFKRAFWNTLRISFSRIIFTFPVPILFALLLNEVRIGWYKKLVQTVSYLPHFMSWVIIAGFVKQMCSTDYGVINVIRRAFGQEPFYFLGSKAWFLPILLIAQVWAGTGWSAIIYLAAMSGVNPELYESADLDGANRVHKAWYITLPSIAPIVVIQLILSFSSIMKGGFDPVFNLYNGLTMEVADIIDTYSFRAGLENAKYDYASAIGLFQNVIGLFAVLVVNRIANRVSEYGIW